MIFQTEFNIYKVCTNNNDCISAQILIPFSNSQLIFNDDMYFV